MSVTLIKFFIEFLSIFKLIGCAILLFALIQLVVYQVFGFSIYNYIYKMLENSKIN